MLKKATTEKIFLLIIVILFLYASIENYIILKEDNVPFIYDVANLYFDSLNYYNSIKYLNIRGLYHLYFEDYHHVYPPYMLFQSVPFYFIFGPHQDSASLSNLIPLFILLLSTYFIVKKIENSYAGILSVIVLFSIPVILPASRVYLPDFALASLYALSIALLLYSDFFSKRKQLILLGVTVGIGFLVKWTFIFYFSPVFVIYVLRGILNKKLVRDIKTKVRNFLLFLGISIIISSQWYIINFDNLTEVTSDINDYVSVVHRDTRWTYKGLKQYLNTLFNYSLRDISYLLYLSSAFLLLRFMYFNIVDAKGTNTFAIDIFIWFLIALLLVIGFPPNARYVLPFIVLSSIYIGIFLYNIFIGGLLLLKKFKVSILKKPLIFITYLCIVFLFFQIYNYSVKRSESEKPVSITGSYFWGGIFNPRKLNLKIDYLASLIINLTSKNGRIALLEYSPTTELIELDLKRTKHYAINIFNIVGCLESPFNVNIYQYCKLQELINNSDLCNYDLVIDSSSYDVVVQGLVYQNYPVRREMAIKVKEKWESCKTNFTLVKTIKDVFRTPDSNSTFYFYKKDPTA